MPKLTRQDWEMLRDRYNVAFSSMHEELFILLLDKVYSPKNTENNPGSDPPDPDEVDDTDALMIYLAHAEPPVPHAEPRISPGG